MLEIFNQLVSLYTEIYKTLPLWEQIVLTFWGVCVIVFCISFLHILLLIVKSKIKGLRKKPQPQRF